ncbi:Tetratricopeptide repeat protein 39C [Acropora cervicornis]|uniref:Tetratricopeptide repeat protein 39C n=1 Tax=Acropora cervicornis TaxID=6130 RepID=A0AAD9V3Q4_ACRCE|nr:Tetratricopeptide repeat protein 39C [Acropora cervicornis]
MNPNKNECKELKEGSSRSSAGFWEYHGLARDGINLLLNNGFEESQKLFRSHSDESPLMSAGSGMVQFVQAILTFEDDQLDRALESLKKAQKVCYVENTAKKGLTQMGRDEQLMRQILYADCELYMALLTFLKQGITDYIKGGYLMRRAWKLYDKCYYEISAVGGPFLMWAPELRGRGNGVDLPSDLDDVEEAHDESVGVGVVSPLNPNDATSYTLDKLSLNEEYGEGISPEALKHLQAAVSCGYGLFHLAISLVPPKLLKFCHLLGFSGNRDVGIQALNLASQSEDMKAPVARLTLLWYHAVIRPFVALDEGNNEEDIPALQYAHNSGLQDECSSISVSLTNATAILEESYQEYPSSAVFLFFKGLVSRLKGNIGQALDEFHQAMRFAAEQKEIALICQYEVVILYLVGVNYLVRILRMNLLGFTTKILDIDNDDDDVTIGILGSTTETFAQFKLVPKFVKKKTPLELFLVRKKFPPSEDDCLLLALEILYVWRAFNTCSSAVLNNILSALEDCKVSSHLAPLKSLVQGAVCKAIKKTDLAVKDAIVKSGRSPPDPHVTPFAYYELGVLYAQDDETSAEGEELLKKVKDNFSGYDFENRLSFRVHAALARIEERKTSEASRNQADDN